MNLALPYIAQIRGSDQASQIASVEDDDTQTPSDGGESSKTLGGWIALTFNGLVASITSSYHREHNTDDTHSGNMTLDGTPLGKWAAVTPTLAAVGGTGGMTVTSVTLPAMRYTIINRLMIVSFSIRATVGGTVGGTLSFAVPMAKTAASLIYASCTILDNGTYQSGYSFTDPSAPTKVFIVKQNQAVFTAGTVACWGQIAFEIHG